MDYPQWQPGVPSWPAAIQEIQNSVRWVRNHSAQLGIDPTRVAAIGESSGAHLAALLGLEPDGPVSADAPPSLSSPSPPPSATSARVQAVVEMSGPTDLPALYQADPGNGGIKAVGFLGGYPDQIPGRFQAASPVDLVSSGDPPMLLIQGTADTTVPASQATELADALTAAGVPHQLILVPGAGHTPQGLALGGHSFATQIVAFLNQTLGPGNSAR
jgi:acetyl esterase/lipase